MPSFVRSGAALAVNSQTASNQTRSSITGLADGGFVLAWQTAHTAQDGSGTAIKLQRYTAQGVAVGGETLVNNVAAGDQSGARVTSLASGGYVVTWESADAAQDGSGTAIKARLFDSAGAAMGGEFRVNSQTFMDQKQPATVGLADGGFVVAWYTTDTSADGSGWAIKAQRFTAAGAATGAEFRVNTVASGSQNNVDVASLANGGFIVTWQTGNSLGTQVYAQAYGSDGAATGTQILVTDDFGSRTHGRVAGLPNGGFVVTWQTEDASGLGIYAQLFDASRNKLGGQIAVNTLSASSQYEPDVAALADGTFLISWQSQAGGIKGQAFTATGQRIGGEFLVADEGDAQETEGAVAALSGGNFVVGWTHTVTGSASGPDIRLQMLAPNRAPELGDATRVVSMQENNTSVGMISATDTDGPSPLSYSIAGGADAARFSIYPTTGFLTFVASPNFEAPGDSNGDNVYEVIVRASDGELHDLQAVFVTVTNLNEAPTIISNGGGAAAAISIVEHVALATTVTAADVDNNPIAFSISGGADAAAFAIDAATGALTFVTAPDFDQPGDADANNVYQVVVRASDGQWADTQTLSISITRANDAPVIVSDGGDTSAALDICEGGTAVTTVVATDSDGPNPVGFSITGGADAALFTIDAATGALAFAAAPDHEAPADAGADNFYDVVVTAGDGELSDSQAISVWVRNVNEGVTITSSGGADSVAVSVDENQAAVAVVSAVDADGSPVLYAISGGTDAAWFVIDAVSGELRFAEGADHEAPGDADGDNVYEVIVSAEDGWLSDTQAFAVSVGDVDEPLAFTSYAGDFYVNLSVAENGLDVAVAVAEDPEGEAVAYAIVDSYDGASFVIDPQTGALRFATAPDHESPADLDGDNVYGVLVSASDGAFFAYQTFLVAVGNANEGVTITSGGTASPAENGTAVATVTAADADGDPVAFALAGGADAALFALDSATGALSFLAAPDFEDPADADGDNVYEVVVSASDGTLSDSQTIAVTVANVDEDVAIVSYEGAETVSLTIEENGGPVGQIAALDPDGEPVTYSLAGGADAGLFDIDAATGALSFLAAPDFEAPADAGGDNVYEVAVVASSATSSGTQAFAVAIVNANEGIFIVSNGGGTSAELSIDEGGSHVTTVVADDPDGTAPIYSITGGADSSRFAIDAATGVLSFVAAPDFEAPADEGGNNFYTVEVGAGDGEHTASQTIQILIGNVNEGVSITSGASVSVGENGTDVATVTATDVDGDPLVYAIAGGADAGKFAIDAATGALSFLAAPDFEAPGDAGADNVYDVIVSASDGAFTDSRAMAVSVGNVNEGFGTSWTGGGRIARENRTLVGLFTATDLDGDSVTYSITDGDDAALFTLDSATGALSFIAAPDYENPASASGTNSYRLFITASDGSLSDERGFNIIVVNENEAPAIVSNGGGAAASVAAVENSVSVTTVAAVDPDGTAPYYAIVGGADAARFAIGSTGILYFLSAPNFEAPTDAGADNVYDVIVSASDGSFSDTQAIAVTVGNANEGVTITSHGGAESTALSVAENGQAVTTVAAGDADGGAVAYAIAGGADAARFTVDAATGALAFVAAPNFEAPGDAGANNVYDVVVSASDGTFTDTQAIAVGVGNVNEAVVIGSNGGGDSAAVSVSENAAAVTLVAASDADGGPVTYAIAGGADAARFTINAATGALAFVAAPNFEAPADSGADNVYNLNVSASDGSFTDTQALTVSVLNVREGNTITGSGGSNTISTTTTVPGQPLATQLEDTIYGMGGADTISGAGGADIIDGGIGNDTLIGGLDSDLLIGGAGADRFVLNLISESQAGAADLITDFTRSQGDKINLNPIDANANAGGNQNFTFIGAAAFSGAAGQLRFEQVNGDTFVSGDVNGDRVGDFQIQLDGLVSLISSDFML